jgi:hypothetical protein
MPKDHYFPSRTTGDKAFLARASTDKSVQGLAAAWLISIAIIASWMLALLFPLGLSFANSRHDSPSYPSDHFLKGDRLSGTRAQEGHEVQPVNTRFPRAFTSERSAPVGCDLAFSRLVRSGNFIARCVTMIDVPTELALARSGRAFG